MGLLSETLNLSVNSQSLLMKKKVNQEIEAEDSNMICIFYFIITCLNGEKNRKHLKPAPSRQYKLCLVLELTPKRKYKFEIPDHKLLPMMLCREK